MTTDDTKGRCWSMLEVLAWIIYRHNEAVRIVGTAARMAPKGQTETPEHLFAPIVIPGTPWTGAELPEWVYVEATKALVAVCKNEEGGVIAKAHRPKGKFLEPVPSPDWGEGFWRWRDQYGDGAERWKFREERDAGSDEKNALFFATMTLGELECFLSRGDLPKEMRNSSAAGGRGSNAKIVAGTPSLDHDTLRFEFVGTECEWLSLRFPAEQVKTAWLESEAENWGRLETATPSAPQTIKSETDCRAWLKGLMTGGAAKTKAKPEYQKEAEKKFPRLSGKAFNRAWGMAMQDTGNHSWGRAGALPKSERGIDPPE